MDLIEKLNKKVYESTQTPENIHFWEIMEAKAAGDYGYVSEASLGRAYQHYLKSDKNSFAIITAYRGENTSKENRALQKQLEKDLRNLGLGFSKFTGHWRECRIKDVDYEDCPPENLVDSTEESLFVTGIKLADAKRLSDKYGQDGTVYFGPEMSPKEGGLIWAGGKVQPMFNKFSANKIGQTFSTVRGKRDPVRGKGTFLFEGKYQNCDECTDREFLGFELHPATQGEMRVKMSILGK